MAIVRHGILVLDERDALGFSFLGHLCLVLVDCLEDLRVSVCTFYEGCSLAVENGLSALKVGVDQADDLESRTEFVFESERMAKKNDIVNQRVKYGLNLITTYFQGPSSLPNMMFCKIANQQAARRRVKFELTPAPIIKTLKSAPGAGGDAL